jgi:hypothetical protein
MFRPDRHFGSSLALRARAARRGVVFGLAWVSLIAAGCTSTERVKATPPPSRYTTIAPKTNLPEYLKGTVLEVAVVEQNEPYPVSGYGLVVGLAGTGDNRGVPQAVRGAMIDEMVRHRLGSSDERLKNLVPEAILADPRSAIVEVYGLIPPGARAGERADVFVQAVTGSQTSSLSRGNLYATDLYMGGVDALNPKGRVNSYIKARGPIFVNPGFATGESDKGATARSSLRTGIIMNGGLMVNDRPIWLRARQPELRVTRAIDIRINDRFGAAKEEIARTQDEGVVYVFVPARFGGDWEHFVGICTHLYLDGSPAIGSIKAKMLAQEAVKPKAALQDISYCLEGIGKDALPFIQPLYTNAASDVVYAAARAGAFLGDSSAEDALLDIARTESHPFQLNAVKTLGALAQSTRIDRMLMDLLSSKNALVRIEAYQVLADHGSPAIISREVHGSFYLDRVPSDGLPMVYATRSGVPRIAVFGPENVFNMPVMFSTLNDKFTISTLPDRRSLMLFDRTNDYPVGGVERRIRPDLYEMVWRLSGGGDDGFRFGYSDLVGILQSMSSGKHINCAVVLQDSPAMRDAIEDAPPIVDPNGRPPVEPPITGLAKEK